MDLGETIINFMEKQCTKCKQTKSITDFHKKSATSTGYRAVCKECILGHAIIKTEVCPINHKICSTCKKVLHFSLFSKASRNKDNLACSCKNCISAKIKNKRKIARSIKKENERLFWVTKTHQICKLCNEEKPVSAFPKYDKIKYRTTCKLCSNKTHNQRRRSVNLKSLFNLTVEQYEDMAIKQENKCAICNIPQEQLSYNLVVDHDHVTEKVRSLLCAQCNLLLGNAKDTIDILNTDQNILASSKYPILTLKSI